MPFPAEHRENFEVTTDDEGSSDAPVTFEASPFGVTIDRGDILSGSYAWDVSGAAYVTITTATCTKYPDVAQTYMKVTGGYGGVLAMGDYCRVSRVDACNNDRFGINVDGDYTSNVTIENCLARGSLYGIYIDWADYATVKNCTA